MNLFFYILLSIVFGAFIGFVEVTANKTQALETPPPMTLEETEQFFSTFKLEE